ncbi:MAG: UpxY family transcription antiterminator [Cytophagales bacterium]|nr:UpxY family transcription antiterminator [Cytophagales bacterium]
MANSNGLVNWYALHTRPRNEKKVTERLAEQGFEVFCPLIKTLRQWSDRKRKVQVPMFPSYIFCRITEKDRNRLLQDPGVMNFVFWLGKPAVVREEEIAAIKKISEIGEEVRVASERLKKGKQVKISEGPFKGLTGKVDKIDNRKVIVWIEQLGCMVRFKYKTEMAEKSREL